jgi:hypothetical protein
VLALFGALLHGSLYLVLGATTLLPQALRAGARLASGARPPLPQARARAAPAASVAAAGPDEPDSGGPCSFQVAIYFTYRRNVQVSTAKLSSSYLLTCRRQQARLPDAHSSPLTKGTATLVAAHAAAGPGMPGAVAASAQAASARVSCMPASGLQSPLAHAQVAAVAAGAVGAAGAVLAGARPSPMAALCLSAWGAAEAAAVAWERARQGAAPGAALLGEALSQ